jgi:hypothetical protein
MQAHLLARRGSEEAVSACAANSRAKGVSDRHGCPGSPSWRVSRVCPMTDRNRGYFVNLLSDILRSAKDATFYGGYAYKVRKELARKVSRHC